jgi:hypothetical protein
MKNEIKTILEYNHLIQYSNSLGLELKMEADTWFITYNTKIIATFTSLECVSAFLCGFDYYKNEFLQESKDI